jgi:spore germination protein
LLYDNNMKKVAFCLLSITSFSIMLFLLHGCYSTTVQPTNTEIITTVQTETIADEREEEPPEEFVLADFELPPPDKNLPVSNFREIWAYLYVDREWALKSNYPITDLVYFGATVNIYGKLEDMPNFKNISSFRGRKHFVATCNSKALTHFVLMEGSSERKALIRDLLEAAKPYDGLQIDFEELPNRDGEVFLSFLRELRAGLGNKIF